MVYLVDWALKAIYWLSQEDNIRKRTSNEIYAYIELWYGERQLREFKDVNVLEVAESQGLVREEVINGEEVYSLV